jgi:hypothetical protein
MSRMKGARFPGRAWRRSLAATLFLGGGLLVAGCSSGGSAGSFVASSVTMNASSTGYEVTLSAPGCPTLGDVSVTFDGEAGHVVTAGGTVRDLTGATRCENAALELTRAIDFTQANPRTEMTVSGSATIHVVFTQLVGPVTLDVVGAPPLTPGSTVTFALHPSSDVFLAAGVGPKLRWDTPGGIVSASDAQISGGMITASIPDTVSPGDQLSFSYGQGIGVIQAATEVCEGAASCAGYPLVFVQPAQITVH